jgi:hypothetical protein
VASVQERSQTVIIRRALEEYLKTKGEGQE